MPVLQLQTSLPPVRAAVVRSHGGFHLRATQPIPRGQWILALSGLLLPAPGRHSVQVGPALHLEAPPGLTQEELLDQHPWRFLNHSCDPSARLRGRDLLARRRIEAWEELTFDYDTTEYDMAAPFPCHCGSPRCRGWIRGYRHLAAAERRRLRPQLADHLCGIAGDEAQAGWA